MGTNVTPARKMIYLEGARFRGAVSEELIQRIGASINLINIAQHSEKQYIINGTYNILTLPYNAIDGLTFFQFDAEIIDVFCFVQFAGSGGTTEIDLKYTTASGGSFSSIFSTTPKITSAAGNYAYVHVGSAVSGTTAPVLSTINMNAGWAMRCDLIQAQTGTAVNGCGIIVHYRPR